MIRSLFAFLFLACVGLGAPVDASAQSADDYDVFPEYTSVEALFSSFKHHDQTAFQKEVVADMKLEFKKWCEDWGDHVGMTPRTKDFADHCMIAMEMLERAYVWRDQDGGGIGGGVCDLPNYFIDRVPDGC